MRSLEFQGLLGDESSSTIVCRGRVPEEERVSVAMADIATA